MISLTSWLLWTGCVIGGDRYLRPRDLDPDWLVDRTRLLGVTAEPAEARPGDVVTFRALFGEAPEGGEELAVAWLACPVSGAGNGFGCELDLGAVDPATLDPEALAELGFIGFEPGLPPVYVVPDDLLDPLTAEERLEGSYVLVQVTALPFELLNEPLDDLDFSIVESGYKRLVVSEAATPNHNPGIERFTVDGLPVPDGAIVQLDVSQSYDLGVELAPDAVEIYEFAPEDGPAEAREEEPYASWFATGGEVSEEVTLWPYLESTWTSPDEPGVSGTWYAVLRDRRGGLTWFVQPWVTVR